jgi:hypothetical protein
MATKTITFTQFGVTYRSRQFAAVRALEIAMNEKSNPLDLLSQTEVMVGEDFVALDTRERINQYVADRAGVMRPILVLRALCNVVGDLSCGIAKGWKGVRVPSRFTADGQGIPTRESEHVDPVIAALIGADKASLRDLEEYYSLEDALKMFDVLVAKGVNEALANEAAQKKAKR